MKIKRTGIYLGIIIFFFLKIGYYFSTDTLPNVYIDLFNVDIMLI